MSNASVPQTTIDLTLASLAVTMLKSADPGNASLHRALDKAIGEVRNGRPWQLDGNRLTVESRTRPGLTHTCTVAKCECQCTRRPTLPGAAGVARTGAIYAG